MSCNSMNKIVPVIIVISTATMASVAANAESGWALDIEKHFEFLGEPWEASRVDYISCVLDKDIAFMKEETEEAKAVIAGKASETRLSYPKDWIDFKYYVKALSSACKDISPHFPSKALISLS